MVRAQASQIDRGFVLHLVSVHGIAAGVHRPGDQHGVADLQTANLFLRQRRSKRNFPSSALKPAWSAIAVTGEVGSR